MLWSLQDDPFSKIANGTGAYKLESLDLLVRKLL